MSRRKTANGNGSGNYGPKESLQDDPQREDPQPDRGNRT
jgi:hypothetical protein